MFARTLETLFKPSVILATKLSRLFVPEQKTVHYHRQVRRFKTSSRRLRKIS